MRRALAIVGAGIVAVALAVGRLLRRQRASAEARTDEPRRGAAAPDRRPEAARGEAGRGGTEQVEPAGAGQPVPSPESRRSIGLALVLLPAAGIIGTALVVYVGAPWLFTRAGFRATPKQPIYFSHEVHADVAGLDCEFCHRTADRAATAGVPDVQQCMFCHAVVEDVRQAAGRPQFEGQIPKLRAAWVDGAPIDWARIHRLPDHSRFPHDAHVQAGIPCADCHGEVERMEQVRQVRSLKMGDCVACHQQTNAPTDCVDCHY